MRPPASRAENLRGAAFMGASMVGFSLNDALIKTLADDLPLFQAVFLRGIFASLFVGSLAWGQGALRFRPGARDRRLIAQRSFAEILGTACFLTALFNMPIANATAILQSVPLAVTLGAAAFLGESVGWRRYAAIAVGFLGVLVIVRPGSDGFTAYALLVVATVFLVVLRDLSTRALSPDAPAAYVVFVTSLAMTAAFGVAALATEWRPVALAHLAVLAAAAGALLVGYVFGVNSMRTGEIGFTQPFRYTLILWAILFGIVLFGEWPDAWMLAGSAIVVGAGIFTLRRERRRGAAPALAASEAAMAD
ncbi:DMT family transporter [Amaricoccus sp.]|uniref:DMT family transporter n=1 Tax=Amaricoccus sp. TaxID=1872485 RepID=UPI001B6BB08F|nr:DMT family transporter [Amaricoccus sp.]MBP7000697.1 DMT family transporter [Amaricoccus sp.]